MAFVPLSMMMMMMMLYCYLIDIISLPLCAHIVYNESYFLGYTTHKKKTKEKKGHGS
jgi:hypothetical protein